MRSLRAAVMGAAGVVCAACALLAGCQSAPLAPPDVANSPTGGLGLLLWYAKVPTNQYQYFKLSDDGKIEFSGGMTALNRKFDWTGKVTPEQGKAIRDAVDQTGWLSAENPARDAGETPLAEIELFADGKTRRFKISGPDPEVQKVVDALQMVTNQRFQQFMQRLPEAGQQRK